MNKKCSSCGGNLVFNPSQCVLVCEKCLGTHEINKTVNIEKHNIDDELIRNNKKNEYTNCANCGASINLTGLEVSGTCPYCNSNLNIGFSHNPDAILPFKIDKQKAIELYKKNVKKRLFLPNAFKKNPTFENLTGFYIPSFSFDCDTKSTYSGKLAKTERDSDGETHTETFYISGTKNINYRDTFIESSSKLNQTQLQEILPFNTNDNLFNYNDEFIAGYTVENFDNSLENCKVIHENIIKSKIENAILSQYSYTRVISFHLSATFSNVTYSYVLLPVYSLKIKYKDKNYLTFLNGQNGNLGKNLPKSRVKITFFILSILLVVFGFIALFLFLE